MLEIHSKRKDRQGWWLPQSCLETQRQNMWIWWGVRKQTPPPQGKMQRCCHLREGSEPEDSSVEMCGANREIIKDRLRTITGLSTLRTTKAVTINLGISGITRLGSIPSLAMPDLCLTTKGLGTIATEHFNTSVLNSTTYKTLECLLKAVNFFLNPAFTVVAPLKHSLMPSWKLLLFPGGLLKIAAQQTAWKPLKISQLDLFQH